MTAPSPSRLSAPDRALALAFGLAAVLTRIPFRARLLPSWDAVQFALALRDYDVVKHQPHPPGYLLYVALGRGLDLLLDDPTGSLTWLAILASGAAVAGLYVLAWRLFGRPTALAAASGFLVSPLFWFHGEVALSYAVEAALAIGVALTVWPRVGGARRAAVTSALTLGLAGGVRQSLLVVLFPLWLGMAWRGTRRWGEVARGLGVLAAAVASWLGPMLWLSGGPARYGTAALELYDSTVRATTVLAPSARWLINGVHLAEASLLGLGLGLPLLGIAVARGLRRSAAADPRRAFLALWLLPPLAVYTLVHTGQYGYLLTVLPALYLLVGHVGARAWQAGPPGSVGRRAVLATAALGLAVHAGFFALAGPVDVPFPSAGAGWATRLDARLRAFYRFELWAHTAGGLRERERVLAGYVAAVRREFDPSRTVLMTEVGNPRSQPWFRHARYYLPEFATYSLRTGGLSPGYLAFPARASMAAVGERDIVLPANVRQLVWMVDAWDPRAPEPPGLARRALPEGRWLYVLDLARRPVEHAGYRLTPVIALARTR